MNKLHLLHLKKFHSTHEQQEDSNCILWLHYAKKFDELKTSKETAEDFKDDNDGQMIIDSDYMLNAKFLLGILENDKRLKNKLSVARLGRTGRVFNIRIIDDILYSGFNLNGFDMVCTINYSEI